MVALFLVALLFVGRMSNSASGSSQGAMSCSDVPRGENVSVSWITFERWMRPTDGVPTLVAFASAVADKGSGDAGRRKVKLEAPELVTGELPPALSVDKIAIRHAKAVMRAGDRVLAWGYPVSGGGVVGNLAVVSGDGSVTFLGNCIPRFDSAFAAFAASRTAERPVDVLVRMLTDPTGETATRFEASAGKTLAGP